MSREKLPNRRLSAAIVFQHENFTYTLTYSRYVDGRLAEIFLDVRLPAHPGDPIDAMAKDMATLVSIALQHGISEDEILASLSQERDGTMRGPLGRALQIIQRDRNSRPPSEPQEQPIDPSPLSGDGASQVAEAEA